MKKLWISYAWADNKSNDVDFIAQELSGAGLTVKLDRWNIQAGGRLWEQVQEFISSEEHSDGWLLVATQNSLSSQPCREEFSYALDRALSKRGSDFPILALFIGPVDDSLVPPAIKVRLHVSISDVDWKDRVKAALERRPPNVEKPQVAAYAINVHRGHPSGKVIVEVRPRAGRWAPVLAGVPIAEKDRTKPWLFVEPAGVISGTGMVSRGGEQVSVDGKWWLVSINHQASPTESLYVWLAELPSELIFGSANGSPQFTVSLADVS